jgi:predicted metal-binding membrane protein
LLFAGYAAAWALFGLVAHGFDAALQRLADRSPLLLTHGWLIGAAIVYRRRLSVRQPQASMSRQCR